MTELPRSSALVQSAVKRLRVVSVGRRFYVFFLIAAGLYAAVLLVSRLSGLIPDLFEPRTLLAIPVAALLFALLAHRRPTVVEAARRIDERRDTKDLFLTVTLFERAAGQYKPLVARDAEDRAPSISAVDVVPYRGRKKLLRLVVVSSSLLAAVLSLDQYDPFGKLASAAQDSLQQQKLTESRRETRLRAARLKREDEQDRESKELDLAIDDMKASLQKMKPKRKQENFAALKRNQKVLDQAWKISAEELKDLLSMSFASQRFGGADKGRLRKWARELQQGSTKDLDKELEKIQAELKKLEKTKDPVQRAAIQRELKKKLDDLQEFASKHLNSKGLSGALKRAAGQQDMSKLKGLSDEALTAMAKSLELAKLELQEIAQSAKDLKKLEEALQVLQMAKRLNEREKLDGQECEGCQSLEDYAELYAKLMAQCQGEGDGGMQGPGTGRGGEAPEDDSLQTGFKTQRSQTALQAGKVLLSLKTKGLTDSGDARKNYRSLVDEVKQGLSEAILQERIPPGYHEGIKKYFDTITDPNRDVQ